MNPVELIRLYNWLVGEMVKGKYRPAYGSQADFAGFNANRLAQALALGEFLDFHGYDPGEYLTACFNLHKWAYRPKLEKLAERKYEMAFLDGEGAAIWRTIKCEGFELKTRLLPGREIIKLRFASEGKADLCRVQKDLSGGYHPDSPICQRCTEQDPCEHERTVPL
jgi:hypothetical protein